MNSKQNYKNSTPKHQRQNYQLQSTEQTNHTLPVLTIQKFRKQQMTKANQKIRFQKTCFIHLRIRNFNSFEKLPKQ